MKIAVSPSFADSVCDLRVRKIKSVFFQQVNRLIDWSTISKIINKHYTKGQNAVGQSAYDGLLLFKMCLLQTWYGLSDYEVEDRINDSISFGYFCGLTLEQPAPDHSTLSRFRSALTKTETFEKLFKEVNRQLEAHQIIVKTGAIIDASVIDTPRKPKGKASYIVTEDRAEEVESNADPIEPISMPKPQKPERQLSAGVDKEASWIKKGGKLRYGYKKHHVTNLDGLVLGVVSTSARVNEISNLEEVIASADLPERISFKGDKGFKSKKNDEILKHRKLKNHILKKAVKGKPLTARELAFNKAVGKERYKVERTFGSIRRWFSGGVARYVGLSKMHTQNLMEALCYNLYRSPGIAMSNSKR